jgi:hypothetical protein
MVFEMLVCSPLNHLTQLIARENFIILIHTILYPVKRVHEVLVPLGVPNWYGEVYVFEEEA